MNKSNSCSSDNRSCESGVVKNILKIALIILLGFSLFIYMVLLFTGSLGDKPTVALKTATPAEIEAARDTLYNIAHAPVVKDIKEIGATMIITVNIDKWKKLDRKGKKEILQRLGKSRAIIGLNPSIKVIDERSVEHASFEHNRLSLGDFDF
jgi:hypothetical protein